MPGVPGCLEYMGVIRQLIREDGEGKGDLSVLWLDLANAHGSIPHNLIVLVLQRHHVPSKITDYYSKFRLRATTGTRACRLASATEKHNYRLHHLSHSLFHHHKYDY